MNTSLTAPKELKEKEEYVNHIHVEADGSEHMLLWVQRVPPVADQQLHVKRQEQSENQSTKSSISSMQPGNISKWCSEEQQKPGDHQHHHEGEK